MEYQTSELGLASYLYASGHKLLGLDRANVARVQFEFSATNDPAEAEVNYRSGEAKVGALAYWEAYQKLKKALFSIED